MKFAARVVVKFGVLLTAAAVACAAAPAGDSLGTAIARGVHVGNVVLTGLTVQPAREQVRAALAQPVVFHIRGQTVAAPAERFRVRADVDGAVRAALRDGGHWGGKRVEECTLLEYNASREGRSDQL